METRNVLQPQFLTGGEAIGLQLEKPTCRLKLLNLSWNGLRQGSAKALGTALGVNTSLIELNLEYNALGQEGVRPWPSPLSNLIYTIARGAKQD
jgi:hypothetical protein